MKYVSISSPLKCTLLYILQGMIFIVFSTGIGLLVTPSPAVAQETTSAPARGPSAVTARPDHRMTRKARDTLKEIFKDSIVNCQLVLPEEPDIVAFKTLIKETLGNPAVTDQLKQRWNRAGWKCSWVAGSGVLVIREKTEQRFGRGIYAIRQGGDSRIILQAPHRFNDAKTGVIARKLFQEHDVWAVGLNTVHRKDLDLAHCDRHYFNAFTEAVVERHGDSVMLQLHGFSNAQKTNAGKTARLIVSDTTKFPGRDARRVATEFKTNFGRSHTRLYPVETRWLGGTDNQQSRLVQQLGGIGFLHMEMNPEFRQQLASDASVRKTFFDSIAAAIAR